MNRFRHKGDKIGVEVGDCKIEAFMQIKGLHKNIYKQSSYALSQEKLEKHQKNMKTMSETDKNLSLRVYHVSTKICQDFIGIIRATYYRYKSKLKDLAKGIFPSSKKPKILQTPRWGESEKRLVLKLHRENPIYGKAKIVVILKRDHNLILSESTVGRILNHLTNKGLLQKSLLAPRQRRRRQFNKHSILEVWNECY